MSYPARILYNIHDAGQHPYITENQFLSIELSPDGFSYCILDTEAFKYISLESYELNKGSDFVQLADVLEVIVKGNKKLSHNYQRVSIALASPLVTFIPAEIFTYSEKNDYIDFNFKPDTAYEIKIDKMPNLASYAVYLYPRKLLQKLDKLFPAARLKHSATSILENLMYMARHSGINLRLVLHVQARHFEIIIFEQQSLVYYNSFRYQTWDDLFYYLFYVLEQLGLDAENLDTMLYGEVDIYSDFYKKIRFYVKSVSFGPRNDMYKYSQAFDDIPHHYFFSLLNLNLCG